MELFHWFLRLFPKIRQPQIIPNYFEQATGYDFQVQNLETNAAKINLATLILLHKNETISKTPNNHIGTNDLRNEGKNKSILKS